MYTLQGMELDWPLSGFKGWPLDTLLSPDWAINYRRGKTKANYYAHDYNTLAAVIVNAWGVNVVYSGRLSRIK